VNYFYVIGLSYDLMMLYLNEVTVMKSNVYYGVIMMKYDGYFNYLVAKVYFPHHQCNSSCCYTCSLLWCADMSMGSMGVNEFTQFTRTCHLIDKTVSAGAVYQIFVRVNVEEEYDPDNDANGAGEDGAIVDPNGRVASTTNGAANGNNGGNGEKPKRSSSAKSNSSKSRPTTGTGTSNKKKDGEEEDDEDDDEHKGPPRRRRQRAHLTIVDDPNNPDSRFLRGEFMESLVRLAMLKYKHRERGAAAQLLRLMKKHVLHYGVDRYLRDFQKRLDSDKLEPTWDKYTARLYDIFLSYAALNKTVAESGAAHLNKDIWNFACYQAFLKDHEIIDGNLSRRVASVSYGLSADENLLREWQGNIQPVIGYPSFLQLIGTTYTLIFHAACDHLYIHCLSVCLCVCVCVYVCMYVCMYVTCCSTIGVS
jgi:hypothetical protein